jgi:hypothetical protein
MDIMSAWETGCVAVEVGIFEWPKIAADGAAGTGLAETPIGLIGPGPVGIALGAVQIHPATALTADPTNNATITVSKRTAANPGTAVPIAIGVTAPSGANSTGSWTAWQAVPLTVQPGAGSFVSPGDALTVTITKGGTGVVVPIAFLAGYTNIK